jgi:hypothetical protein
MTEELKATLLSKNEVESYFIIDECGAFIWRMNHEMSHGRVDNTEAVSKDIENVREIQQLVVDNLKQFGVDPESVKDHENGNYWKWYHFWDNWKKSLSDDDWDSVSRLMSNSEPFDEFLPKESWNEAE